MVLTRFFAMVPNSISDRLGRLGNKSCTGNGAKRSFHVVWSKPYLALAYSGCVRCCLLCNSSHSGSCHRQILLGHIWVLVHCGIGPVVGGSPFGGRSCPHVDTGNWNGYEYRHDLPHCGSLHQLSFHRFSRYWKSMEQPTLEVRNFRNSFLHHFQLYWGGILVTSGC